MGRGRTEGGRPLWRSWSRCFVAMASFDPDLRRDGVSRPPLGDRAPAAGAVAGRPRPARRLPPPARDSQRLEPGSRPVAVRLLTIASRRRLRPRRHVRRRPPGSRAGDRSTAATGSPGTASWYASPEFGDLQSGTGLLLDMGETVNLSRVQLGPRHPGRRGRSGSGGRHVAGRTNCRSRPARPTWAGTVQLRLAGAARGRYVLIWFTRLPPDLAGQVSGQRLRRHRIRHQEDIIVAAREKVIEQT